MFCLQAHKAKLALTSSEYLENVENIYPRPSIRIAVNRQLTNEDIDFAFDTLNRISKNIVNTMDN